MDNRGYAEICLPWPPSVNTYWRRRGNRVFVSEKGILYRNEVISKAYHLRNFFSEKQRINVEIIAYPPDKRRRDLDNILKSLLDSLQHAKVYVDDNQIDKLNIIRMDEKLGKLVVKLMVYHGISSSSNAGD